jgi:5-methylcytosine-specific restriction endonuclease McrA
MPRFKRLEKKRLAEVERKQPQRIEQSNETWRSGLTTAQRGYGGKWQVARLQFLNQHPLCAECQRNGHIASATVIDHIIPHRGNQDLFWDRKNWQALCKSCHDAKTRSGQ